MTISEAKKQEYLDSEMSYADIARELGVSRQAVSDYFKGCRPKNFRYVTESTCVYPGLRRWMNENYVTVGDLIERMGIKRNQESIQRYRGYLSGKNGMRMETINRILKVTGLTYEKAFRRFNES